MLDQIRHGGKRSVVNHIAVHHLKGVLRLGQPFHHRHVGPVNRNEIPDKGLKKVVVGVDEAGIQKLVAAVDHPGAGRRQVLVDFQNRGAIHQHVCMIKDVIFRVTCNNGAYIFKKQLSHGGSSLLLILVPTSIIKSIVVTFMSSMNLYAIAGKLKEN